MRLIFLTMLTALLTACGGGGGASQPAPVPVPPAPTTQRFTLLAASGTLAGEHDTVGEASSAGISFQSATEGLVRGPAPSFSFQTGDGLRNYTVTWDSVLGRVSFFRSANNTNIAVWVLSPMTSGG